MEKIIDNSILTVDPGQEKIGWVEWEYLKTHATHIRCNRCHYGKQEEDEGLSHGYKPAEIKEAELNIAQKQKDFLINGWRENCCMLIGFYNGNNYVIDGNNRWTGLCRVNKNSPIVPYIHVIVRYYDSEEDMQKAFDETNGNMVPQKKTQKIGRNARLNGGKELEGFNIIQDYMAATGTSISTASVLYTGYRTNHSDVPSVSKDNFVYTADEIANTFKSLVGSFNDSKKLYMLKRLKGVEFAMGFQSVCGKLVRYVTTMMADTYNDDERKEVLEKAYIDIKNAIVKKCNRYHNEESFRNDFRGRSADYAALISEICRGYDKSENKIFNAVFEHYDKVAC